MRSAYPAMLNTAKIILKNKDHTIRKKNDTYKRNYKFSKLMIESKKLLNFRKKNLNFFTGVPDSVLKKFYKSLI